MKRKYSYKKKNIYTRLRRRNNLNVNIKDDLNRALRHFIRGKNIQKIPYLLGCNRESFFAHIESQFQSEMSWDNYGKTWHIDHIHPCANFDLTLIENQKACYHFSNLRPLFKLENMKKSFKCECLPNNEINFTFKSLQNQMVN